MKKSSVLIFSLWLLSLLAVFSVGLGKNTSANLLFSGHIKNRLITYYLAKAGIEMGIGILDKDDNPKYDCLSDSWANNEALFRDVPLGPGYITLSYSLPGQNVLLPDKENGGFPEEQRIFYGIMDEASKININLVPVEILENIISNLGQADGPVAREISNSILDWRDIDIIVSQGGAEERYYQSLDIPYECKNRPFEAVEELLLVKGVTPEIFSKIKDVITVYGNSKVNVNTASWVTLHALGFSENLAKRIVDFREGDDGLDGTEDDNFFETVDKIRDIGPLFTEESVEINTLIGQLAVTSNVFRIKAKGSLKEGGEGFHREIACVISRENKKETKFLYWNED